MAVDVVVVNYRTPNELLQFCASYKEFAFEDCTLTVVDVDPTDPVVGRFPGDITWLTSKTNIGFGAACNWGAADGENDVILLANADTLLSDGFRECHDALMSFDHWGVLGPRQVNEFGQIKAGGIFGHPKSPAQRGWDEADHGQFNDIREDALSVSGALYFIKRKLWEELTGCPIMQEFQPGITGAFIETPHYFEDMTCSVHARAHGYKCVFYGPVQMTHYWHRASPHGGWADMQFAKSQQMHREFCALHGALCE